MPSSPQSRVKRREAQHLASARRGRCPSRAAPRRSRLVSTVTATSSGRVRPVSAAVAVDGVARGLRASRGRRRVHVQHPDAEPRRRRARLRDGVRNVVELEIEEHVEAALDHPAHRLGSGDDEQLLADLQPAVVRIEAFGEPERAHRIGEVERDDDARAGCSCWTSCVNTLGSRVAVRHLGALRRVRLPFLAAGTAPIVLPRAKAAVVAFVQAEALDVLADEPLDELEIVPPLGRRRQQLRLEQSVEADAASDCARARP